MSGDLNIDEFRGDVYSDRMNTEYAVRRFYNSSVKLRTLSIRNSGNTYNALIGLYTSSITTFSSNAFTLVPNYPTWLEFVDLYNLGYLYTGGLTSLEIIGTY